MIAKITIAWLMAIVESPKWLLLAFCPKYLEGGGTSKWYLVTPMNAG